MAQTHVYWEPQESGFCGVHCLNNLLQGAYFSEIDLAGIGLELDETERRLMAEGGLESAEYLSFMGQESQNVDNGGHFSIEVLRKALAGMGLHVVSFGSDTSAEERRDPTAVHAFIFNLHSHWYTVRKLNGKFFNLNSLNENGPMLIGEFYLGMFLQELQVWFASRRALWRFLVCGDARCGDGRLCYCPPPTPFSSLPSGNTGLFSP